MVGVLQMAEGIDPVVEWCCDEGGMQETEAAQQ